MSDKDKDFSIKDASKQARADFPKETRPFLFMDVHDQKKNGSPKRYGHWMAKVVHRFLNSTKEIKKTSLSAIKNNNSYAYRYTNSFHYYMVVNNQKLLHDEKYAYQEKYFTFDHELAHLLTSFKKGDAHPEDPIHEGIADAYAAIRSIQRFGDDSVMIQHHIWMRSHEGIHNGGTWDHFTLPVLEKILEDSKTIDFSKLSPQETIELATEYGKKYSPTMIDVEVAQNDFRNLNDIMTKFDPTHLHQLESLSRTTLSSSNDFNFRIGVRAFQPFLAPEGVNFNDQHIQLSRPIREMHILKLSDEARKRGMDDLVAELKEEQSCFLPIAKKAKKVESKSAPAAFSIKH